MFVSHALDYVGTARFRAVERVEIQEYERSLG